MWREEGDWTAKVEAAEAKRGLMSLVIHSKEGVSRSHREVPVSVINWERTKPGKVLAHRDVRDESIMGKIHGLRESSLIGNEEGEDCETITALTEPDECKMTPSLSLSWLGARTALNGFTVAFATPSGPQRGKRLSGTRSTR